MIGRMFNEVEKIKKEDQISNLLSKLIQ